MKIICGQCWMCWTNNRLLACVCVSLLITWWESTHWWAQEVRKKQSKPISMELCQLLCLCIIIYRVSKNKLQNSAEAIVHRLNPVVGTPCVRKLFFFCWSLFWTPCVCVFVCVRACLLVYHLIVERGNREQSTKTRAHQFNSLPIKPTFAIRSHKRASR